MANRSTKAFRAVRDYYGRKTGRCINSSEARQASGKRPYNAPTQGSGGVAKHPVSGLTNGEIQHMARYV
jgi:hypothetical protein